MEKINTHISISLTTKDQLDSLKERFKGVSYDKIITQLLIEFYKNQTNE
jgi:hypothetical protein